MNMEKTFICDYCKNVFTIAQRTDHTIKCQDKFMIQKYNQMNKIGGNNIKDNKRYNLEEKEVEEIISRNNITIRNQKHSQDKAKVLLTENFNNIIPVISRENKMNKNFNNNIKSNYGDQVAKTFYVEKSINNAKMIHELPKIKVKKEVPLSMNKKGKSNINILKKNLKLNYSNEKVIKLNGKLRLNIEKEESRNKEEEKLVKEEDRKITQKGDNNNRKLH